jgi:NADP-dependent 3-hydroxy acid dehydrogenase YdfG
MSTHQPLSGAVALVTGASAGIGRATATALARRGADVAVLARREDRLDTLATDLEDDFGVETLVLPADVSDEDAVAAAIDAAVEAFGRLDVAVSNAGVTRGDTQSIDEFETTDYRTVAGVNIDGTFFLTREAFPHLVETGGNLIYVGSFDGHYPRPNNPVYAASKWWVRGFARSVAGPAGERGVGVTIVNPAKVRTEIEAGGEPFEDRFDPGEVLEPEDVADAIAFAATQAPHATVNELDIYTRDKYSREGF